MATDKLPDSLEVRRHIRALKRTCPYLFNEWNALEEAKARFAVAEAELHIAQDNWAELGEE